MINSLTTKIKTENHDVQKAVKDSALGIEEYIKFKIKEYKNIEEMKKDCKKAASQQDCAVIYMDMHSMIEAVQDLFGRLNHKRYFSCDINDLHENLRLKANEAVRSHAAELIIDELEEIKNFMEEYCLSMDDFVSENPHVWWRHYAETPAEHYTIYHYRNLENEQIHYDVIEYNGEFINVTFCKSIDADEVSEAENRWEAT